MSVQAATPTETQYCSRYTIYCHRGWARCFSKGIHRLCVSHHTIRTFCISPHACSYPRIPHSFRVLRRPPDTFVLFGLLLIVCAWYILFVAAVCGNKHSNKNNSHKSLSTETFTQYSRKKGHFDVDSYCTMAPLAKSVTTCDLNRGFKKSRKE